MSSRLAILAGLLSGILVAALVLGGIFVLAPQSIAEAPTPTPSPSPSPTPSPTPTPTASPSPSPTPTPTPTPSSSPSPSPSATSPSESPSAGIEASASAGPSASGDASFGIAHGGVARVDPADGSRRSVLRGALGGIGPDAMARGLQSIVPDVTVTP